jgi:hypothetical protein
MANLPLTDPILAKQVWESMPNPSARRSRWASEVAKKSAALAISAISSFPEIKIGAVVPSAERRVLSLSF